jgi:hypothetical protein
LKKDLNEISKIGDEKKEKMKLWQKRGSWEFFRAGLDKSLTFLEISTQQSATFLFTVWDFEGIQARINWRHLVSTACSGRSADPTEFDRKCLMLCPAQQIHQKSPRKKSKQKELKNW